MKKIRPSSKSAQAAQAAAIKALDFCIVPYRPSAADLEAVPMTVETIKRLKKLYFCTDSNAPCAHFEAKKLRPYSLYSNDSKRSLLSGFRY